MLQDLLVYLLIDRLALWKELAVDDASHIEERVKFSVLLKILVLSQTKLWLMNFLKWYKRP